MHFQRRCIAEARLESAHVAGHSLGTDFAALIHGNGCAIAVDATASIQGRALRVQGMGQRGTAVVGQRCQPGEVVQDIACAVAVECAVFRILDEIVAGGHENTPTVRAGAAICH